MNCQTREFRNHKLKHILTSRSDTMRKLCVFLLFLYLLMGQTRTLEAKTVIKTQDRSLLSYEILDVKVGQDQLVINGWGVLHDKHHFYGPQSHEYKLELKSSSHKLEYLGTFKNINLTRIMAYQGYPTCSNGALNKTNCNYNFNNTGFEFKIPLSHLKTGHQYTASLKIVSKALKTTYKSDLYYPKDHIIQRIHQDRNVVVQSHYQTMKLDAFYHTLIARTKPDLNSDPLKISGSCSSAYGNRAYFKANSLFHHIRGINIYDGLITYFKVNVKDAGCNNLRRRVIEGNLKNPVAYIPSLYVNYHGEPLKIKLDQIYHKPIIQAENQTIQQFSKFIPNDHATASDKRDGNLTMKVKVTYNNVNTLIPGQYKSCYEVHNSLNKSDSKCIRVDVIKANTYYRFVNKQSLEPMLDKSILWKQNSFKSILERILAYKP